MLYKHSFSILCEHLNLNKKRKIFEFSELPVKLAGIPVRTVCTKDFKFKFDFDRFEPVSGQTGPIYRYRTPSGLAGPVGNVNVLASTIGQHLGRLVYAQVRGHPSV